MTTLIPLSPSDLEVFKKCPQRFVWNFDKNKEKFNQVNLPASLGNIAHRVLSLAHRGKFRKFDVATSDSDFENIWSDVELAELNRIKEYLPDVKIPDPIKWPRYFAVKSSTRYLVRNVTESSEYKVIADLPCAGGFPANAIFPWVERYLTSEKLGLKGIPDLVSKVDGGVEIIDYKTGSVDELDAFSFQLHTYLNLVREVSDIKVTRLVIRDFALKEHEIQIDENIAQQVIQLALDANSHLLRGEGSPNVGLDNCKFCPFKSECTAFQASDFPETTQPLYLEGEILRIHRTKASDSFSVEINVIKSVPSTFLGKAIISGLKSNSILSVGDCIKVTEQLNLNNTFHVVGNWGTRVIKL